ncbi:MAG: hypothetical protein K0R84_1425 [Clostridia bacterium]|jgi:hypothetical protein|nr:hypothetical protein [Clostridia bacterium]
MMKETVGKAVVGLRNKKTHELIAIYPHSVDGLNQETEKMVKDWYYKQDCAAETELRHCFVDIVRENELH